MKARRGPRTPSPEDILDPVFPVIVRGPPHGAKEDNEAVDDRKGDRRRKEVKQDAGPGDPSEGIVMEAAEVEIRRNDRQKDDAEEPGRDLQPASAADAQKGMDETDVEGNAEDEEEMDRAVDAEGEALVGQNGNDDHIGIEEGAEKQMPANRTFVRFRPPRRSEIRAMPRKTINPRSGGMTYQ